MSCGLEPVDDAEDVLRRVPQAWYPNERGEPQPRIDTFLPTSADLTGLSLSRAKYRSIESAARGSDPSKVYHVASLQVSKVRSARLDGVSQALEVTADPQPGDDGHTQIPLLYRRDYDSDPVKKTRIKEWARKLASSVAVMALVSPPAATILPTESEHPQP